MVDIRKKWLFGLLLSACLLSGYMLMASPEPVNLSIKDLAEIDQVILSELKKLESEPSEIRVHEVLVDSLFTRKHYAINLQQGFPSTAFHANMAMALQPKGVRIEGERVFPQMQLKLHFIYSGKLVRTADIQFSSDR